MLSAPAFSAAARSSLGCRLFVRRLASSGRTADPKIHARNDGDEPSLFPSDPEGLDDVANPKIPADEDVPEIRPPGFVKEPLTPPKTHEMLHISLSQLLLVYPQNSISNRNEIKSTKRHGRLDNTF